MIRHRTDSQVLTSAGQMDAALAAGVGADTLTALVELRAAWHQTGQMPAVTAEVAAVLHHQAVIEWDAVFVQAVRRYCESSRSSGE